MARSKNTKGRQDNWVRTGGFIGDPTMAELEQFHEDIGPVENCGKHGGDPNAKFDRRRQKGSEA